jgi:hypothetical protein
VTRQRGRWPQYLVSTERRSPAPVLNTRTNLPGKSEFHTLEYSARGASPGAGPSPPVGSGRIATTIRHFNNLRPSKHDERLHQHYDGRFIFSTWCSLNGSYRESEHRRPALRVRRPAVRAHVPAVRPWRQPHTHSAEPTILAGGQHRVPMRVEKVSATRNVTFRFLRPHNITNPMGLNMGWRGSSFLLRQRSSTSDRAVRLSLRLRLERSMSNPNTLFQ